MRTGDDIDQLGIPLSRDAFSCGTIRKHYYCPFFLVLDPKALESGTEGFRRRFKDNSLVTDLGRDAYQQGRLRLHHLPP